MDNTGVINFTAEDQFDITADLDMNIGEIPPKETPAGWIIVETGVTENISFTAKEITIACGVEESGAPSSVMFMDEQAARDELSSELKAVQDEAKENFWKGVKSVAIGALCVGFAVATGGV
ncbi:MAG: hypothetical protein ACK5NF_03370, partial [Bacilli bacterium]